MSVRFEMGNAWATQDPATAANAISPETVRLAVLSQMLEPPQTPETARRYS
jgi:hypothetical protein